MGLGRFWWWVVLILVQFDTNGCFGCWEQEKAALLQIKSSINSTTGIDYLQTWNSTNKKSDCCDWERVKCDNTTGRTIQLDLSGIISWSREDWCLNASLFLPFEELQYLDLEGNWISRWVPNEGFERFSMLHKLEMLNLANNGFNNNILSSVSGISSLKILDLSENKLNGSFHIPGLCELRNLREISLYNNHLEGILPSCMLPMWMGNMSQLTTIVMANNQLEGPIPIELCKLFNLEFFDLSENNLFGLVPSCFNLSIIKFFHLNKNFFSGPIPNVFQNNSNLVTLNLRDNYLNGSIPDWIGRVSSLSILLLGANHLEGTNLRLKRQHLRIRNKRLAGEIPPELGKISNNLRAMNLSHNNLTGPIPTSISNLKQMESLDLSYNNLNGTIPPQLTEMTSLEVFSVAHNNLSGTTPDRKNQFITFEESSYEGNPLLCGPPLHNDCTKIGPAFTTPMDYEEEGGSFMDMSVFYISFVVVYITVLLGIVAVLYINPYWRRAWFNLIEVCIDTCYCFVVVHYCKLFKFRLA
nr:lrr receptor-like serine/threonine-protein kinase gso1 [Quercus suber]